MKPKVFKSHLWTTRWVVDYADILKYFTTWKEALEYANTQAYSNAMALFKSGKYTHTNAVGEDV